MFNEGPIDKFFRLARRFIPTKVFRLIQPSYHYALAILAAFIYRFPSRSLEVIAITGTKGKSTIVAMITRILEDAGYNVASIGSLGLKIGDKTWPNTLKMTMPGRFKLQRFIAQARDAGVTHLILEVTSEGISQHRLVGIDVDTAVMTNLRPEHIESHGSFEKYKQAKQKLFAKTKGAHILNVEDPFFLDFNQFNARQKVTYGLDRGMVNAHDHVLHLKLAGDFNRSNALAALAVAYVYDIDLPQAIKSLEAIDRIAGRMDIIHSDNGAVVIDYAHTPDSLEKVYSTIYSMAQVLERPMICVLGAAGGGRDRWKRPLFGKIAEKYCDKIILTDEDPFDEDPQSIIRDISDGIKNRENIDIILDRETAIHEAIIYNRNAYVIITGKGSEVSMALANGEKIPWSDREIALKTLNFSD